jgi:hypothetical protein
MKREYDFSKGKRGPVVPLTRPDPRIRRGTPPLKSEDREALWILQVERHAAFVAMEILEVEAVARTHFRAIARGFDFENVRTPISKLGYVFFLIQLSIVDFLNRMSPPSRKWGTPPCLTSRYMVLVWHLRYSAACFRVKISPSRAVIGGVLS